MAIPTMVVGCGAVAQRLYRKALQRSERQGYLRVTALVDPVVSHAAAMGTFFPAAKAFDDLDQAFRSAPQLALILTPAHLHCRQAVAAMENGCHVLCEKPMASTEEECSRMIGASWRADRVLAIGMIRRFFPGYAEFQRLIDSETLGKIHSFTLREGHKFEWQVTTPAAFRPRAEGGTGVLFDIGPHVLDYLLALFGSLQVKKYADDALGGVESNAVIELETQTACGEVSLSWDSPQRNELRVKGSQGEGVLRLDRFDQYALSIADHFEPRTATAAFPADLKPVPRRQLSPKSYSDAIYCQLIQTLRSIELGEKPAVSGDAASRCVAVMQEALDVAAPLEQPWLSDQEQHSYRELHWNKTSWKP